MKSIGKYILSVIFIAGIAFFYSCNPAKEFDVLIVGGGASGTAAGIQASRLDSKTLIVEEFEWLGGALTSAGVSCIDGNYKMPAGIFGEFRDYLSDYYGGLDSLRTGWVSSVCAEPSVMNAAFKSLAAKEKKLEVWYKSVVSGIEKRPDGWVVTINRDGKEETVRCRILIDGTELGDIAKACGVKYDIGMDDRDISGEDIAPEDANDVIQDITYVAILKDFGEKDMTIEKPAGYDPSIFYCTCKNDLCSNPDSGTVLWEKHQMITYGKLPNNKYMINWPINGNDYYVNMIEMDKEQRDSALQVLKNFTLSYVYFMRHNLFDHIDIDLKNTNIENGKAADDGSYTVLLSTEGKNREEVPKELVKFLEFIKEDEPDHQKDYQDTLVRRMQQRIRQLKEDREVVSSNL